MRKQFFKKLIFFLSISCRSLPRKDNYCYNIKEELRSYGNKSSSDRFQFNLFRKTSNNPIQERKNNHNTSVSSTSNSVSKSTNTRLRPKAKVKATVETESPVNKIKSKTF